MSLGVGDVNEAWNGALQVQQRMQLDAGFGRPEGSPRVDRQAQVDGSGVEGVNRGVQIDSQGFLGVHGAGHADQVLGKIGIDLPRSGGIRIGQRIARDGLTAKAHVVQPPGLGSQVHFDIAQRFSKGQLRKRHGKKLIQTREVLDLVIASMRRHTPAKCAQRQIYHELRKHELALVHGDPSRDDAKDRNSDSKRSNRDQNKTQNFLNGSLTYRVLM